jgi:competence protein ComEC
VLGELAQVMPMFDRSLDMIIVTNPDLDHIGGFLDVLDHYKVGAFMEPGTYNTSETYKNLKTKVQDKNIKEILARRGTEIDLGGGAMLEILFPDRDVSDWTTNDGSVVARLTYGENSFMLMGDSTIETEKLVLAENPPESLDSDILKVGHHGSRTSTSENFLKAVTPEYALISLGKDNKYNHPHREVLDVLDAFGAKVLRTDQDGTILFKCDKIEPCEIKE